MFAVKNTSTDKDINHRMEPEKRELLEKSKQEFARRRKVLLSDIPDGVDLEVTSVAF